MGSLRTIYKRVRYVETCLVYFEPYILRSNFTNNRHFLFLFSFISVILQVPVIQLKNYVMKPVIVHLMGNINFAIILVIHTGGVKDAVISKIIAGNRNFFANGQKYRAMTLVNVSSYIDDTLHFINVLKMSLKTCLFLGHIHLIIHR